MDISLPSRDFVSTVCPGLNAFQDAIKWSLAQSFSSSNGRGYQSTPCKHPPIMDAAQVAGLVAYTAWMIGTKACAIRIPLGCNRNGACIHQMPLVSSHRRLTDLSVLISPLFSHILRRHTEAHLQTVSEMAMQNTLSLATALKPTVMSQGKYTSQEFESFRRWLNFFTKLSLKK